MQHLPATRLPATRACRESREQSPAVEHGGPPENRAKIPPA